MPTMTSHLPANWRDRRTWELIDLRRELRLASKELEERNELSEAAAMHRELADLDDFLCPLLHNPPSADEWEQASEQAARDDMQREAEGGLIRWPFLAPWVQSFAA